MLAVARVLLLNNETEAAATESWLPAPPATWFTLSRIQDLMEPKSVCPLERSSGKL